MLSALIVSEARMPSQDAVGNIPSKVPVMERAVVSSAAAAASVAVVSVVAASFFWLLVQAAMQANKAAAKV